MSTGSRDDLTPEQKALRALNLPFTGEFPFVPPKGWTAHQPLHGPSDGGYYDRKGWLWKEGRSITKGQHFEWDVQVPKGSHINIDWHGRITHPRPKVPDASKFKKTRSKRKRRER